MKNLKLWYLYDFANSFASSVVIFYFPLILLEAKVPDFYIGASTAISTLVLLILYPYMGKKSDFDTSKRLRYIRASSVFMALVLILIAIISGLYSVASLPILLILCALYIIFQIAFQGSYVFYTAQMQELEESGHNKNKLSSVGMGLGQLGNAVSIGLMSFIVGAGLVIFGLTGKSLALFLGAILFTILGIPYLIQKNKYLKKENQKVYNLDNNNNKSLVANLTYFKSVFSKIYKNKKIFYFVIGYALVADSISTFQVYLSIYMKKVFLLDDKTIGVMGAISLFSLFLTCMVYGHFEKRFKNKKFVLIVGGSVYLFVFSLLAVIPPVKIYIILALISTGIAYGLFFPIARSIYSDIIPKENQAEYFSSFVIFERSAAVFGPILWLGTFYVFKNFGEDVQYRGSVFFLVLISLFGLFFLKKSFRI